MANTMSYNAVLAAMSKAAPSAPPAEQAAIAHQGKLLFHQMRRLPGAFPDGTTYSTLVNALARSGDHVTALEAHDQMLQQVWVVESPGGHEAACCRCRRRIRELLSLLQLVQDRTVMVNRPEVAAQGGHSVHRQRFC